MRGLQGSFAYLSVDVAVAVHLLHVQTYIVKGFFSDLHYRSALFLSASLD